MLFKSSKGGEEAGHDHCCNNQKRLIKAIIKSLQVDKLIQILDKVLKPLPSWVQSTLSTVFISVVPILFIYSLNLTLTGAGTKDIIIKYGISFAIGGLLGDVFYHTMPDLREAN